MKPFSCDDLYLNLKVASLDAAPSPARVLASVKSADRKSNSYISHIWKFHADGRPARQMTFGSGEDSDPQWSPDGESFAFISDRSGSPLPYLMGDGTEAHALGDFPQGVTALRWCPDGRALLVSAARGVDPDLRGARGEPRKPLAPEDPEVAWRLPYKQDGSGYMLGRETHLHYVPVDGKPQKQLTDGAFNVAGFEASPDGKQVAYVRTREGRYAHRTDLWVCGIDGTGHRQVTNTFATVSQPAWSPDGRSIAFGGAVKEGDGEMRLWLLDLESAKARPLGPESMELALPESLHWAADGKSMVVVRAIRGRHEVVRIPLGGGPRESLLDGDRQFGAFAALDDFLFVTQNTAADPCEVLAWSAHSQRETRVSDLNPWWRERTPLALVPRQFTVPDGRGGMETIEGWLLHARDAKSPMPLLDEMHGGPASYALLDYDVNVARQVLCSQGWCLLFLNAVGSSSFGSEFCSRLSGHWGKLDFPQHQVVIKQLKREGVCNDRVAVSGASYGGYLSAWAISHSSEFKAAVVMAPVGNIETHYGTSDGGYYADPLYMDTAPEFDREKARSMSPLQFIEKARTPTLFLQGKEDERCPKCQSEELFVSLYRASDDVKTELVLYPNEGHKFISGGKPKCRVDASQRYADWLTRHT